MPLNYDPSGGKKKLEEDKGLLSKILSGSPGKSGETEGGIAGNLLGAAKFLNPASLVPSLIGGLGGDAVSTGKELARVVPTAVTAGLLSATGSKPEDLAKEMDASPASFALNTDYIRNAQKDQPLADTIMDQLHQVSPLIAKGAEGIAGTGIRGGAELASGISRAPGVPGGFASAPEMLKGTRMEGQTYGEAAGRGELFPMLTQDILTVAPGARGLAGGLEAAGAPGVAGQLARAADLAEKAPLAPYSIPAKGIYGGIMNAVETGGPAFPRLAALAEKGGLNTPELPAPPVDAISPAAADMARAQGLAPEAIAAAERVPAAGPYVAQGGLLRGGAKRIAAVGDMTADIWRAARDREEGLTVRANALDEIAPQRELLDEKIANATSAEEKMQLEAEKTKLLADTRARANATAQENIQQGYQEKMAEKLGGNVQPEQVKIPEKFSDAAIQKHFEGLEPAKRYGAAVDLMDDVTDTFKTGVLPANPAWQAGNVISNAITAMTYGGVDPVWLLKNRGRLMEQLKRSTEGGAPSRGAGQAAEFLPEMGSKAKTTVGKVTDKVAGKAYALNQVVDDISHEAVYLRELDRLKEQGVPLAEAQKLANRKSLQTMGDFQNMSAFEKNIARRAIPFYTWSKHATKMALREPMANPVLQGRLASVANVYNPQGPDQEGNDFLKSAIPLGGGKFLTLPGSDMSQGGLTGAGNSPLLNPRALGGSLNPIIQAGAALGGLNLRKMDALEKAPGQSNLSAAAGYATNLTPLSKMAGNLVDRSNLDVGPIHGYGQNIVQGDVRNPLVSNGKMLASTNQDLGPLPAPLLKFLTGSTVDQPDLKGAEKRAAKKEKTAKKSEKAYEKALNKKAK